MRMQYQQRAEPVAPGAETIRPDKWLPLFPVELRRRPALIAAIVAGSFFYGGVPVSETVYSDKWAPTYPDRLVRSARIFPIDYSTSDPYMSNVPVGAVGLVSMALMGVGQ